MEISKEHPPKVLEVLEALNANAKKADCYNTMYIEYERDGVWRIMCNYERHNSILAYVVQEDKWYYQKMYGDFYPDNNLKIINGSLSQPMRNNHHEALANTECWYTG